jgi:AAA+ ATPase superfamily predicted ATPase
MEFYDRKEELKNLLKKYQNLDSAEFCVIFGRRRLGKTAFVQQFLKNVKEKVLYIYISKTSKTELLSLISENINEQTGDKVKIDDWRDFFNYLYQKSIDEKFVLIMDEFARLKTDSPDFLTKFQDAWDSKLSKTKLMFIAIGSSMSMMYDIFMDYEAPLYGRMTSKIVFQPFRYVDFRDMFKEVDEIKKIEIYSVFGGTPHFLWFAKKEANKEIIEIIDSTILSEMAPLKDEPTNFITMELKKETNYNSVLYAISKSDGSRHELLSNTGIPQKEIDYYLNNLIELLKIVYKFEPMFYKKSHNIRYRIMDNFFNFWYKFIFPNQSLLEIGEKKMLKKKIDLELNSFIGYRFEEIVKELLILYNGGKKIKNLEIDFDSMGPWWGKNREGETKEIEIVTNNKIKRESILCEVKWTNQPIGIGIVKELNEKYKLINVTGAFKYLIVSKSGFNKECLDYMDEKKITHLDLKEIAKLFDEAE